MRLTMLFLTATLVSTPLWAMHCPMDMAKIDEQLQSNPPADPAILTRVKALREEGEKLHNAGDHDGSLKVLGEAQDLLNG